MAAIITACVNRSMPSIDLLARRCDGRTKVFRHTDEYRTNP